MRMLCALSHWDPFGDRVDIHLLFDRVALTCATAGPPPSLVATPAGR
jgi:hypothetical protein